MSFKSMFRKPTEQEKEFGVYLVREHDGLLLGPNQMPMQGQYKYVTDLPDSTNTKNHPRHPSQDPE